MTTPRRLELTDADATEALGRALAAAVPGRRFAVALTGPLGAGKSTLARSMLRALGVAGAIPSPTYTIVEPYEANGRSLYHVDLYRLGGADEVEVLGLTDVAPDALMLIEWPELAEGYIEFDLAVGLDHAAPGRVASLRAITAAGERVLDRVVERRP